MCLTRPETMLSLCTVPLNACGIDTTDPTKSNDASAQVWDFVLARLESMRVNSCTTQVKDCLQSVDRCGSDYSQCIGLDTDTIIRMCPQELLVGCQDYDGGNVELTGNDEEDFYAKLEPYVQGIMLNIDNNILDQCQTAADEAMISVCGDTENCNNMAVDEYVGTNTLEYRICAISSGEGTSVEYSNCYTDISQISDASLGRVAGILAPETSDATVENADTTAKSATNDGITLEESLNAAANQNAQGAQIAIIIEGDIPWNSVSFNDETGNIEIDSRVLASSKYAEEIRHELGVLQNNINNAINAIESDTEVQWCMTGRTVQGINDNNTSASTNTSNSSPVRGTPIAQNATAVSAISLRNGNNVGASTQLTVDRSGAGGRFPGLTQQMRAMIASSAIKLAMDNYYAKYAELENKRMQDYVTLNERIASVQEQNLADARREAARVACVGASEASGIGRSWGKQNSASAKELDMVGSKEVNNWNYKETITSTFSWDTLVCHKCTRTQNCLDPKGGRRFCKKWAEVVETCVDIQF